MPSTSPRRVDRTLRPWAACLVAVAVAGLAAGARAGEADAPAEKARGVLKTYCYRCHGQDGRSEGGLNVVIDLAKLVEGKRVVPGDPEGSKLLRRIVSGEMPPEVDFEDASEDAPPLPRPGAAEVAAIRDWIRAGAPTPPRAAPRPFFSDAEMLRLIFDDLTGLAPRDRRHARYFTLVHLANAGNNEDQLQSYRHGLSKLVNSLSWNRKVQAPSPIDRSALVLRIDLRDYLWDEAIWDAIQDRNPYGLRLEGATGGPIAKLTETELPFVRADWFVFAASRPPLYHDVLRLPETIGELERKLDVDVAADIRQDRVARAGFNDSGISRNNRLIERHESAHGAYWRSYDFAGNADRRNLFAHPLGPGDGPDDFAHDGGEAIFALPNGLNGYMLVDGKGGRIDKGPTEIVRDAKQADGAVVNGISCMSCHNRGFIEKDDRIRDHVAGTRGFGPRLIEGVEALYPPRDRMRRHVRDDVARFARAVKETGSSLSRTEPVFALARQFEADLGLTLAAAESGLDVQGFRDLLARTPALNRALGLLLAGGTVKRDAFVDAFPQIAEARQLGLRQLAVPAAPVAGRAAPPTAVRADAKRWVVLFRGRDPKAWNTRSDGPTVAVPLAEAPADMRFLRLRRADTNEILVIPLSRDRLDKAAGNREDPSAPSRWCGTNQWRWGSHHLGIAEGPRISGFDESGRGKVAVQYEGVHYWMGSGFGHLAHGDETPQYFGWRGRRIAPTDFEVAVSAGPLSASEKGALAALDPPPTAVASLASPAAAARPSRPGGDAKGKAAEVEDLAPASFRGQGRDGFRDLAPGRSVLVGVNVRLSTAFGGSIAAIQPIFHDGRSQTLGAWHGAVAGQESRALARSGYAVGAIRTRTGVVLDGFDLVFMRRRGDRLDPSDSYTSPWFGNNRGGNPAVVSADGRLVVGLHGRAEREVRALGLVGRLGDGK